MDIALSCLVTVALLLVVSPTFRKEFRQHLDLGFYTDRKKEPKN